MIFPITDYKIAHKEPTGTTEDKPDAVVWEVRLTQWLNPNSEPSVNPFTEKQILIIECKKPGEDTPGGWESAETQLEHYCEESGGMGVRVYGAVAIGRKVAFYKYDKARMAGSRLEGLHGSPCNLADIRGQDAAEHWLKHIKATGWNSCL
jgi:alpha-D-ribose 1-methylphosphonate 5-phosphate C-P lyase